MAHKVAEHRYQDCMGQKSKPDGIKWLSDIEDHDYAAAESYLLLLYPANQTQKFIQSLRSAKLTRFKAKDIFRASGLSLLGISNFHVENDRKKIRAGKELSPLLLVREEKVAKVIIADGYHRLCAVYDLDEDAWIECKIV